MSVLDRARTFLWTHARLLERRIFEARFEDGDPGAVAAAVRAYGFGHALEPDLRAPQPQPIHVELALESLQHARAWDDALALDACAFLESVADENGAVPPSLPGAESYPCANHWTILQWAHAPAVNPTAAICAHLNAHGVQHPWLALATAWCKEQIATETFGSAHTLRAAMRLVADEPDLVTRVHGQLAAAEWFTTDVPVTTYTLTPLHFPAARAHFDDALIEAHVDDLVAQQADDGGWRIHWEAPGPAAVAEWRGRWTVEHLLLLHEHGRL